MILRDVLISVRNYCEARMRRRYRTVETHPHSTEYLWRQPGTRTIAEKRADGDLDD